MYFNINCTFNSSVIKLKIFLVFQYCNYISVDFHFNKTFLNNRNDADFLKLVLSFKPKYIYRLATAHKLFKEVITKMLVNFRRMLF